MNQFNSYTEISPSGTGAKKFFVYDFSNAQELRLSLSNDHGKAWKRGAGVHPPAIELYLSNRYFAVTNDRLSSADLRLVSMEELEQLLQEIGPSFAGKAAGKLAPDNPAK